MTYEIFILSEIDLINQDTAISQRINNYCNTFSKKKISINIINLKKEINLTPLHYEDNLVLTNENQSSKKGIKLITFCFVATNLARIGSMIKSSKNKIVILRLPTSLTYDLLTVLILKLFYKNKIYLEKNELKIGIVLNTTLSVNILKRIYFFLLFPHRYLIALTQDKVLSIYNGIIAISTKMENWALKHNSNVIRIPILVDCKKINPMFDHAKIRVTINIGYTGAISLKKEGIIILLNSLLKIKNLASNIRLNFYGAVDRNTRHMIDSFILNNDLSELIKLNEPIPHHRINSILQEQDLLIMSRPSNIQTNYGFSTKLAEYLASGKPILITRVSDNEKYITDGVNGYLVKPNDVEELAYKLQYIISNTSELFRVGMKGRETALKHFDYGVYSNILTNFLFQDEL